MSVKKDKINTKLQEIGSILKLEENDIILARKTVKNTALMTVAGGIFLLLGNMLMPGGPAGLYYTVVSVKDFQLFLSSFL